MLELLAAIPKERLFQLFVDGRFHKIENGWKTFEQREPGCLKAFFNSLQFALSYKEKIDSQVIMQLYDIVTASVANMNQIAHKKIRDNHYTLFDINKKKMTPQGLHEFLSTVQKKGLPYPVKLIDKTTNENLLDKPSQLLENIPYKSLRYFAPNASKTGMLQEIDRILNEYYQEIAVANTQDEKIRAMVRCVKWLELLHPFFDGNGRLFINVLLNKLLLDNGFAPATFYDPNLFDLYATDELVEIVKDSINYTISSIKHPKAELFGYSTHSMSLEDQQELDAITYDFRQFLYLHKNSDAKLHLAKNYLNDVQIYSDCAQGKLLAIKKYLKNNTPDISKFAPQNSSTLYRDLALPHIAARTNQIEILKELIHYQASALTQPDLYGRLPLIHAIKQGHLSCIHLLLELEKKHNGKKQVPSYLINNTHGFCALNYIIKYGDGEIFIIFKQMLEDNFLLNYQKILQESIKLGNIRLIHYYINQYGTDAFIESSWLVIANKITRKRQIEPLKKFLHHCQKENLNFKNWYVLMVTAIEKKAFDILKYLFSMENNHTITLEELTHIISSINHKFAEIYKEAMCIHDDILLFLVNRCQNTNNGCVVKEVGFSLLHLLICNFALKTIKQIINPFNIDELSLASKVTPSIEGAVTPLMLAIIAGHFEIIKLIVDARADVEKTNEHQECALSILEKTSFDNELKNNIKALLIKSKSNDQVKNQYGTFFMPAINTQIDNTVVKSLSSIGLI